MTGKSVLLRYFSRQAKYARRQIIYDPMSDLSKPKDLQNWGNGWRPSPAIFSGEPATRITNDPRKFASWCRHESDCDVFIDESGDIFQHRESKELLTRGRHRGLQIFFAAQRPVMVHPDCRDQAAAVYVFRLAREDMRIVF